MRVYEFPPDGDGAAVEPTAASGAGPKYDLEEQVRRTSESVERLANVCAAMFANIAEAKGAVK